MNTATALVRVDDGATAQICTFRVANRTFGVRIEDIKEINPETRFTRVHQAPEYVLGYLNIRGEIYLIMDIRRILGFEPSEVTEQSRFILFKPSLDANFGFLVDEVKDIVSLNSDHIQVREHSAIRSMGVTADHLIEAECVMGDDLLILLHPLACLDFTKVQY